MNTLKTKINNYLSKYCFLIFGVITFLMILCHTPFWDETHAFNISRLSLSEIFQITRIEGHTFLWYLILKIFCPLNTYPYSILLINWLFCISALFILWKKAPFTPIQKSLITFSTPFLYYFAPIARCYAIGILFLFLICAYYKKRFKQPFLFASFISLTANTSIMAAIGAFYIGLIYLYDLFLKFKHRTISKKHILGVVGIFCFCTIILLLQFVGVRNPDIEEKTFTFNEITRFALFPEATSVFPFILHLVVSISFYYFTYLIFKKTKRGFFFISTTYITLTILFLYIYHGSHWNHYFYFIYFIILFWIFGKKILCNKFSKFLFITILTLFIFPKAVLETGKMDLIYSSRAKSTVQEISAIPNAQNAKIYSFEWWGDVAPGALAYLAQKNINIYDHKNRNRLSFESQKNIFNMRREIIDIFSTFDNSENKDIYIVTMGNFGKQIFSNMYIIPQKNNNDIIIKRDNISYYLKLINTKKPLTVAIYKVTKL